MYFFVLESAWTDHGTWNLPGIPLAIFTATQRWSFHSHSTRVRSCVISHCCAISTHAVARLNHTNPSPHQSSHPIYHLSRTLHLLSLVTPLIYTHIYIYSQSYISATLRSLSIWSSGPKYGWRFGEEIFFVTFWLSCFFLMRY